MAEPVVGRFAPSPSGRMHLGNVLCALVAWLSARSQGGRVVPVSYTHLDVYKRQAWATWLWLRSASSRRSRMRVTIFITGFIIP